MMVNCPACKRAHGDLAPGKYECQCNAQFRVDAQANPKKNPAKWDRKNCAICKASFSVHPSAKTVDTKTRCAKCREAMVEAKQRRQGLQIDPYGRKGRGWKGLKPIDITAEANPKKNPSSWAQELFDSIREYDRVTIRRDGDKEVTGTAVMKSGGPPSNARVPHWVLKIGNKGDGAVVTADDDIVKVTKGRIPKGYKRATENPGKKNPDMSLDKAMRAARAWAKKSGNRAALAHINGYISGAYMFEAEQMGQSEIEAAVPYILANIGSWRGDEAREAKKVMKQALADAKKAGYPPFGKAIRMANPNGDWDNEEDYGEDYADGEGHVCMKCGTDYPCTMEDGACEHHNDVCSECRSQSIYRQVEREMDSEDYQGPNPVKSGRGRYVEQAWMLYPTGMPIPAGWEKVGKEHTKGKRQAQPRPGMIWIVRKSLTGTRGLPRSKKKNPRASRVTTRGWQRAAGAKSVSGRRFFLANQAYTLIRKDGYNWELVPQVGMGARHKKSRKLHGTSQEIIATLYKRGYREGNPSPNPHTPMHLAPKASLDAVGEGFGQIPQAKIKIIGASAGWAVAQRLMEMVSSLADTLERAPAGVTDVEKAQVDGHLNGLQQSIGVVDGMLLDDGIAQGLREMKESGSVDMAQLEAAVESRILGAGDAAPAPMTEDPGTRRELGFSAKGRKPKSKKTSSRSSDEERREIGFPLNNPVKLPKTYKGPAGGHGQAYAYLDALSKEYKEQWNENLQETARKKRLHKKLLDWLKPHMPNASHVHLPKFIAHWMGDSPGVGSERATWQKAYDRGKAPALVPA